MKRFSIATIAVAMTLTTSGCLEGRSFHDDNVVRFTEPVEGDFAAAPLLVKWTGRPPATKSWALFVDRAPIRPGQSIDDLEVQERQNLYVSDVAELTLDVIVSRTTAVKSRRDRHRLIVVPLDSHGRRVGEAAASVELTVVPA